MLKKLDFQKKIFICFSIILFFVLLSSGYIFLYYNISLLKTNIETSSMDSLASLQSQYDDDLISMAQTLNAIHASYEFTGLVFPLPKDNLNYFSQNPMERSLIHSILISYLTPQEAGSTLSYISRYYDFFRVSNYSDKSSILSKQSLASLAYVEKGLNTPQYQFYSPPHLSTLSASQKYVYSVVRPIRDTFQTYGVLEYEKDVAALDHILSDSNIEDVTQLSLLDENGVTYYSCNPPFTFYTSDPELLNIITSHDKGVYYLDRHTLLCYTKSSMTGWIMVMERNIQPLTSNINRFSLIIIFAYILALCLLLLFLYIMTNNMTKPLRTLRNNLSVLENDQSIGLPTNTGNNEVIILTAAIGEILNKLRRQDKLLINTRKRAMQAHFEAMEAQLDPHFLYNTLSVIGACGMESGNRTVPKMCAELSSLLRYSISYTHKNVLLKDEIQNVRSYLFIMKTRYEHMLDYTWDLDESISDLEVPKLIFQPIVENCFQHGFTDVPPPWQISIRTWCASGRWHAAISNNGMIFPPDKRQKLEEHLDYFKEHMENDIDDKPASEKMGFGLENTILRLFIFYKGNEIFRIYENEFGHTTIEIGGPYYEQQT